MHLLLLFPDVDRAPWHLEQVRYKLELSIDLEHIPRVPWRQQRASNKVHACIVHHHMHNIYTIDDHYLST